MSEHSRSITDDIFFEALRGNNIIDEDNMKARLLQDTLNNSTDSMEKKAQVASSMITKLDNECHHNDKQIVVSGRIITREVDLSGIEFISKEDVTIEPEALKTVERTVEDASAISRGYIAIVEPEEEKFTFYQVIETNFYSINFSDHGSNIAQSGKAFVPLDMTSYVSLADFETESMPNNSMLDFYAPDLLDAIDEIIDATPTNSDNLNTVLRQLGELDIEILCPEIHSEAFTEVRQHFEAYLSMFVTFNRTAPYYVSDAKSAHVKHENGVDEVQLRDGQLIPGYFNRFAVSEEAKGFAIELVMPFSDGSLYPVQYQIDQETTFTAADTFPGVTKDN